MSIELAPPESTTSPAPAPTTHAEPVAITIEAAHPRLGAVDALDGETLERHVIAMGNARLQGMAQRVAAAKSRLLDLTGAAEALSMAEDARHYIGADPEHWLLSELSEVQAQIAQAEDGRKRAQARADARSKRVTPLRVAVSNLHTGLVRERDVLYDRVIELKNSGAGKIADHSLVKAGLTAEQIASLGPFGQGAVDLVKYTARLKETAPQIAAIERWIDSGYRDHQHMAGLGFDALIEAAQPVGEVKS